MYSFTEFESKSFDDLTLLFCGKQKCTPGYSFGPAVRSHFLLHFCLSGMGYYYAGEKKYMVRAGQGFLIYPGDVTYYEADREDPWTYLWVGFHGAKAEHYLSLCGLDREHLTCRCEDIEALCDCLHEMLKRNRATYSNELHLEGLLFRFFGILAESAGIPYQADVKIGNVYVNKAVEYIQKNYQNPVSIGEISAYVSLNRSYLATIFQSTLGMSPQQYLLRFRMIKASELLMNTALSVGEIARSCGYPDPLAFSKAFKKTSGQSPTDYRKERQLMGGRSRQNDPHANGV